MKVHFSETQSNVVLLHLPALTKTQSNWHVFGFLNKYVIFCMYRAVHKPSDRLLAVKVSCSSLTVHVCIVRMWSWQLCSWDVLVLW